MSAPKVPKLLYSIPEVAAAIGVSRSTVYELIAAGEFPTVDIGQGGRPRHRIPVSVLEEWINHKTTARAAS